MRLGFLFSSTNIFLSMFLYTRCHSFYWGVRPSCAGKTACGFMKISLKNIVLFASCVCFVGLLVGGLGQSVGEERAAPTLPRLLMSRDSEFGIPFTMDDDETSPSEAVVRLFYSNDYGASWSVAQEVRPEDSKFVFQAAKDGEYWFALDTIEEDRDSMLRGVVSDASELAAVVPLAPGLRVLVDTTEPTLEFEVGRTGSERLWAAWSITEVQLRTHGFHILYRGVEEEYWTSVPVAAPEPSSQSPFEGWTAWDLDAPHDEIVVRVEAIDAVGNSTVFTEQYDLTATGLPMTMSPQGRERTPVVASPAPVELEIAPVSNTSSDGWRPASSLRNAASLAPESVSESGSGAQGARPNMSGWRPSDRDLSQDAAPPTLEQPEVEMERASDPEPVEAHPVEEAMPVEPVSVVRTPEGPLEDVPQRSLRVPVEDEMPDPERYPEAWAAIDTVDLFESNEMIPMRIRSAKAEIVDGETWLKVRWSSGDSSSRDASVSIYYADSIEGPWRTAAESLTNSGRFDGPLTPELADISGPLFIRLEALLEDGSIISTMHPEPVVAE